MRDSEAAQWFTRSGVFEWEFWLTFDDSSKSKPKQTTQKLTEHLSVSLGTLRLVQFLVILIFWDNSSLATMKKTKVLQKQTAKRDKNSQKKLPPLPPLLLLLPLLHLPRAPLELPQPFLHQLLEGPKQLHSPHPLAPHPLPCKENLLAVWHPENRKKTFGAQKKGTSWSWICKDSEFLKYIHVLRFYTMCINVEIYYLILIGVDRYDTCHMYHACFTIQRNSWNCWWTTYLATISGSGHAWFDRKKNLKIAGFGLEWWYCQPPKKAYIQNT